MAIPVALPPKIEARCQARVRERGLALDAPVSGGVAGTARKRLSRKFSVDEQNGRLGEAADLVTSVVQRLPDFAMSREGNCTREDESSFGLA